MKPTKFKLSSLAWLLGFMILVMFVSSCAKSVSVTECLADQPLGFWKGLVHGLILPFSFIVSLFDETTAIYAINNNGGWYNFGFVLGAGIILGGSSKASCK